MKLPRKYLIATAAVLVIGLIGWRVIFHKTDNADDQGLNKPVPVTAGLVSVQDVPLYVVGVGTVQAYNTVNIQARVDGQLDSVDFREGQDVKTGDRLVQIGPQAVPGRFGTVHWPRRPRTKPHWRTPGWI